jgi:hypothetical protein
MATRYVIQTALVFDSSQPQFLLIEYRGDSAGHCVGQFHDLEGAFTYAHERANEKPHLTVIEGSRKRDKAER